MSNRDKLVWAAIRLFHQRGYQGTSIDEILSASGVRRSNLYYHFNTKEELAHAALEYYWQRYRALVRDSLERLDLSPPRRLAEFFRGVQSLLLETDCQHGCPVASIGFDPAGGPESLRRQAAHYLHELAMALARCIEEGVERGEFRPGLDPLATGLLAVAACQGGMQFAAAAGSPMPLGHSLAALQQLLVTAAPQPGYQ